MDIRNLAIIAHVDHGKTTLIDGLFQEAGMFAAHQKHVERLMDSNVLEKERGITITAKNASFVWNNTRINIVDTPGHADFGGEVERALFMVDGALLLVDAAEGPLPQTRFVLRKALQRGIRIIVVINKVDRPDARIEYVEEKILELFYDLATNDSQVSYTTFYASAKQGWASLQKDVRTTSFKDLLDTIIKEVPAPRVNDTGVMQMLVTNLRYSSFLGQIAVGRVESGVIKSGQRAGLINEEGKVQAFRVASLERFSGIGTEAIEELSAGNIALVSGLENPKIGDTITIEGATQALPRLRVDPPSVSMRISVNTSPLAGQEGEYLTSRKLRELLEKVCLTNVSLELEDTEVAEVFMLKARGELQLVVVLEELRRQGYELMAGRPEVVPKEIDGQLFEPADLFVIDIPENMVGTITETLSRKGGRMENMEHLEGSPRVRLEFFIPARGLIGLRSRLLTISKGEAVFSSTFREFVPYQGKRFSRANGALVCDRDGTSVEYGLYNLQDSGKLFVAAGEKVYEGMVFGENKRQNDMNANPTREKKLTNMRASGTDESTKLDPITPLDLDHALEWIDEDEWIEITPINVRIRKNQLQTNLRKVIRTG